VFPGDRFVGEGTEGEFSIVLTDLDGNSVGGAFESWPQMTQVFGDERHQATVSGTTSFEEDPLPETVMIGFQWNGPVGQESEVRFEVEAMFDPHRKEMADQIETDTADEGEQGTVSAPVSSTASTSTTGVDSTSDSGTFPVVILVVVGVAAVGIAVAAFLVRRSRFG
jgi:hypothetical protein